MCPYCLPTYRNRLRLRQPPPWQHSVANGGQLISHPGGVSWPTTPPGSRGVASVMLSLGGDEVAAIGSGCWEAAAQCLQAGVCLDCLQGVG